MFSKNLSGLKYCPGGQIFRNNLFFLQNSLDKKQLSGLLLEYMKDNTVVSEIIILNCFIIKNIYCCYLTRYCDFSRNYSFLFFVIRPCYVWMYFKIYKVEHIVEPSNKARIKNTGRRFVDRCTKRLCFTYL